MEDLLPFNDPKYIAEPYPYWRRLRDQAPVYWSEAQRFWAVTRYDDVIAVLHDPARFSSQGGPIGRSEAAGLPRQPLIQDDPPHHDRLRRILSKAFTPRITADRETSVRAIARELLEALQARLDAGEEVDLVTAFTSPLPVRVIAGILGIPREMHDQLRLWNASTSVTGAASLQDLHPPNVMRNMYDTLADLIEARRSERRDDLFSALIASSESDESPLLAPRAGGAMPASLDGRQRDHDQPPLQRRPRHAGADRTSWRSRAPRDPTADPRRGGGDAPAPLSRQRTGAHRTHLRPRARERASQCARATRAHGDVCRGQPGPASLRAIRSEFDPGPSPQRPHRASATASTSVWARIWRAWRRGWAWRRWAS